MRAALTPDAFARAVLFPLSQECLLTQMVHIAALPSQFTGRPTTLLYGPDERLI